MQGHGQKSEQKHRTKNFAKFPNHLPLLTMVQNRFDFPRVVRSTCLKILEIPGGGGFTKDPPGTEIPEGVGGGGVQIKEPSVGGMDIFWNHTMS